MSLDHFFENEDEYTTTSDCLRCGQEPRAGRPHVCPGGILLLSDPHVPPGTLREVWQQIEGTDGQDAAALAGNPACPPDVLVELCEDVKTGGFSSFNQSLTIRNLARNPAFPDDVARREFTMNPTGWASHRAITEDEITNEVAAAVFGGNDFDRFLDAEKCPTDVLDMIAGKYPDKVDQVIQHPNCDPRRLGEWLNGTQEQKVTAAGSRALTPEQATELAADRKKEVRAAVAVNPVITDPAILRRLSQDRAKDVQMAVPFNPNCPGDVLDEAVDKWLDNIDQHYRSGGDSKDQVENQRRDQLLRHIANHPNLSDRTVHRVIDQVEAKVLPTKTGEGFLKNANQVPRSVADRLLDSDDSPEWARVMYAGNRRLRPDDMMILAGDPSTTVVKALLDTTSNPDVVKRILVNPAAQSAAAGSTRIDRLKEQHEDELGPVNCPRCGQFMAASGMHHCPHAAQQPAAQLHRIDRWTLASHPSASTEDLASMANDPEQTILAAVAEHPNSNKATLDSLVGGTTRTRLSVARNPNAPADTLRDLALSTIPDNVSERQALAVHPNTPNDVLATLAEDENQSVRLMVVSRPGCGHLAVNDNVVTNRWYAVGAVTTSHGQPFEVSSPATALRQALDRVAVVEHNSTNGQNLLVESRDGQLWLTRSERTVSVSTRVEGAFRSGPDGAVVVSAARVKDALKGLGRGTVNVRFDGRTFSVGNDFPALIDDAHMFPAVTAPGPVEQTLKMPAAELGRMSRALGPFVEEPTSLETRDVSWRYTYGVLADDDGQGTRRWVVADADRAIAYTDDSAPVTGTPARECVPPSALRSLQSFQGEVTIERHGRDLFLTDGTTNVLASRTWADLPPTGASEWPPHLPFWDSDPTVVSATTSHDEFTAAVNEHTIMGSTQQIRSIGPDGYEVTAELLRGRDGDARVMATMGRPDPSGPARQMARKVMEEIVTSSASPHPVQIQVSRNPDRSAAVTIGKITHFF